MNFRRKLLDFAPAWLLSLSIEPEGAEDVGGAGGATDEEDDLRADILGAMDELNGEQDAEAPATGAQPRDPGGRFAPKPDEQPAAAAKPQATDPGAPKPVPAKQRRPGDPPVQAQPQMQPKPAPAADQAPQAGKMPAGWLPKWVKPGEGFDPATVPPALREQLYAREQAFSRAYNDATAKVKEWAPIEEKLGPLADHLKSQGTNVQSFVGNLLQVEDWLHKDSGEDAASLAPLDWLAQNYYGADLATLMAERAKQPAKPAAAAPDPVVKELTGRLERIERGLTEQQQAEKTARQNALRQEFADFQSKHPDAADPEVKRIMRGLLEAGQARSFEEAYEKAEWLHPPLRERKQTAQRKSTAERARSAAITPRHTTPVPGAGVGKSTGNSIDDDVRASLAELQ